MVFRLRISGPGLDVVRKLEAGEPELVLGRDADCGVCLPDPQRNVSRRHLSVWIENGELQFRVLSVVNGVEMPFGEAPPGARGVLPVGQTLKVGDYSLCAAAESPGGASSDNPWAVFEREGSGTVPATGQGPVSAQAPVEDDPFGEWGFEGAVDARASSAASPSDGPPAGSGELGAFFRGLGLDAGSIGPLGPGEVEALGALVRVLMLGVLELHTSGRAVTDDLRAEDRTMVAPKDTNPLKSDWPRETKLRYVFGGRAASIGFPNPERSLRDLLAELLAHNVASAGASRAALEATIKEFAPAVLKSRLLGGGAKLFEGARAWDAYCKYYTQEGRNMAQWTQRLLDRYYAESYLRERLRIKRETPPRRP